MNEKTEYIIPILAGIIRSARGAHFAPSPPRKHIELALDTILFLQAHLEAEKVSA